MHIRFFISAVNFINVLLAHFLYKILAPKITKPNITREKLPQRLMYKKGGHKMLLKLIPARENAALNLFIQIVEKV